jgi:predicted secreted protein
MTRASLRFAKTGTEGNHPMTTRVLLICCLAATLSACASSPEPAVLPPSTAAASGGTASGGGPVLAATVAPASTPAVYDEKTSQLSVAVGQRFSLSLAANITTPYKWVVDPSLDAAILALVEDKYVEPPPRESPGAVGGGGRRLLTFEAKRAATTNLKLTYQSITDPQEPPVRTHQVTVDAR